MVARHKMWGGGGGGTFLGHLRPTFAACCQILSFLYHDYQNDHSLDGVSCKNYTRGLHSLEKFLNFGGSP